MAFRLGSPALTLFSLAAPVALAAQDSVATRSTLDSVFSLSQAEKGAKTYRENCTSCHAPAAYTGLKFRRVWTGRSVYDFYDLIRTTMPDDDPGKLSHGDYANIMAYLLKLNGLPAGEKELPSDDERLKEIQIKIENSSAANAPAPPPAAPPPPPSPLRPAPRR